MTAGISGNEDLEDSIYNEFNKIKEDFNKTALV